MLIRRRPAAAAALLRQLLREQEALAGSAARYGLIGHAGLLSGQTHAAGAAQAQRYLGAAQPQRLLWPAAAVAALDQGLGRPLHSSAPAWQQAQPQESTANGQASASSLAGLAKAKAEDLADAGMSCLGGQGWKNDGRGGSGGRLP